MDSAPAHRTTLWLKLGLGLLLLVLAVWLGRDFAHHLPALEQWIASHGTWGFVVFVLALIIGTSLFVPDTLFAVAAVLDFAISRQFLTTRVHHWLEANPRFATIQRAVRSEGLRFLFLLRLTPIHPVTVSYVLGASDTRFPVFLAASLGLIPALFVEVYFGYAAQHLAKVSGRVGEHSALQTALTTAGLVMCVGLLCYVVRVARRALASYQNIRGGGWEDHALPFSVASFCLR